MATIVAAELHARPAVAEVVAALLRKSLPENEEAQKIATAIDGWAVPRLAPTMKGGDP